MTAPAAADAVIAAVAASVAAAVGVSVSFQGTARPDPPKGASRQFSPAVEHLEKERC